MTANTSIPVREIEIKEKVIANQINKPIGWLKPTKHLNSKELQVILPHMNIVGITGNNKSIHAGPAILIGDILYYAASYRFSTIKDIQTYFAQKHKETILVYDYDYELITPSFNKNIIGTNIGDKIIIESGSIFRRVYNIDCGCELVINFLDEDINKRYSEYIFRIYEKKETSNENFKECESTKCVIKNVEDNIENIIKEK